MENLAAPFLISGDKDGFIIDAITSDGELTYGANADWDQDLVGDDIGGIERFIRKYPSFVVLNFMVAIRI